MMTGVAGVCQHAARGVFHMKDSTVKKDSKDDEYDVKIGCRV